MSIWISDNAVEQLKADGVTLTTHGRGYIALQHGQPIPHTWSVFEEKSWQCAYNWLYKGELS